jgi:hypothetical protein
MLQTACSLNATQRADSHRVPVLAGNDDTSLVLGMRPNLVGAPLTHDTPTRIDERLPHVLVLLRHEHDRSHRLRWNSRSATPALLAHKPASRKPRPADSCQWRRLESNPRNVPGVRSNRVASGPLTSLPSKERASSLAVEIAPCRLAALRRPGGINQAACVRRRAEQVSRLLPGGVETHGRP